MKKVDAIAKAKSEVIVYRSWPSELWACGGPDGNLPCGPRYVDALSARRAYIDQRVTELLK